LVLLPQLRPQYGWFLCVDDQWRRLIVLGCGCVVLGVVIETHIETSRFLWIGITGFIGIGVIGFPSWFLEKGVVFVTGEGALVEGLGDVAAE
jgi:hypothetical protein